MRTELLTAMAVLLGGLGLLLYALFCLSRALASRSWPTARGTVTGSFVQKDEDDEGVSYKAKISYRYSVGHREFSGTEVRAGGLLSFGFFGLAERTTDKYPLGATVRVRYLRRNPSVSVLEHGFNFSIAFYFVMAVWLLVEAQSLIKAL